ncbi:hypothetical protein H0H93_013199 [Arthromyces matolae]|nr:hypothetical protein H0H93_013199 [Arthromyces matolae]
MEGRDVDLLFGLDMLKAHQACIDLSKNVLRIQGREVEFLPEHQLPEKARREARGEPPEASTSGSSILEAPAQASSFPGTGTSLGGPPSSRPSNPQPSQSRHSEESIQLLMGLGADRELAIRSLDAANGNVDVAASLLF